MKEQSLILPSFQLDIFTQDVPEPHLPVLVFFVIHGRTGSRKERHVRDIAARTHAIRAQKVFEGEKPERELVIVALDIRNHGDRMIKKSLNVFWNVKNPPRSNPTNALDVWQTFTGTATDVSDLINWLPAYLYPNDERRIDRYAISGYSVGGHVAWRVLMEDPRVTIGVPIIAPIDYEKWVNRHAVNMGVGLPLTPPNLPATLLQHIRTTDSVNKEDYTLPHNILATKQILVLMGAEDDYMHHGISIPFIEGYRVDESRGGVKRMIVQEGVGHDISKEMVAHTADFVWKHGLAPN